MTRPQKSVRVPDVVGAVVVVVLLVVACAVGSTDGRGLAAMALAATRAGAALEVDSTVGEGTTVTATVPG